MMRSVKEFIKAVKNPSSLISWPNYYAAERNGL
jgi:hypothetical protein